MVVTERNIDEAMAQCIALDQRMELVPGCVTWAIEYGEGQRGQMTIWPDGRGAVMWGGDSRWGVWDHELEVLVLDDGLTVDEYGQELSEDDEDGDPAQA